MSHCTTFTMRLLLALLPLLFSTFSSASSAQLPAFLGGPETCPAGVKTACPPGSTCCNIFMSISGFGCCNLPNASCCPHTGTEQGCCPQGTKCVTTGAYSAVCEPLGGGPNVSALQVCTPGAQFPPSSSSLPSVITIGDSVSEGYQPVLAQALAQQAFVQHSPWSVGEWPG